MKKLILLPLFAITLCANLVLNAQTVVVHKSPVTIKLDGNKVPGKEPLYVVDGKVTNAQLNELDPNLIESISVLKDASSVALYGPEGQNGVIVITTKKNGIKEVPAIIGDGGNGTKVTIRGANSGGINAMYIIDGEVSTSTNLLGLDPNKIQSVEILKNASAIALYGPEAANGVIIITTKKDVPQKTKN